MPIRLRHHRTACLACLVFLTVGCEDTGPAAVPAAPSSNKSAPAICSQLHRDVSRWQGTEIADCGPDVTGLLELAPLGNGWLLARRRFASADALWPLTSTGSVASSLSGLGGDALAAVPIPIAQVIGASTAAFTLLPGTPPRILVYDPRASRWALYVTPSSASAGSTFASAGQGQWPSGIWAYNQDGGPWDRQLIGLEDGRLLDRDLGDGSTQIWSVMTGSTEPSPTTLIASTTLVAGPEEHFRRGHRLVHLGPNRLLEWLPRACAQRAVASDPCAGSDFRVWSYSLESSGPLDFQIVSSGFWSDLGDESDVLSDGDHLFVWTRATGRLRSYTIDLARADPLSQPPIADPPSNPKLASQDWVPPTTAPMIKHLLVILQDGHSFDSYFGHACLGAAGAGTPLTCSSGVAWCCEAMPVTVPGAAACTDPDSDLGYHPDDSPECLRVKIDGGAMDGFAVQHPPGSCGDPRDFGCVGGDAALGSLAATTYQSLAQSGALADRFFQTYAFLDGMAAAQGPAPFIENLLYLVSSRFAAEPPLLIGTPLLTDQLAHLQVSWAIYAGPANLPVLSAFGVPVFYDPDWFPYRSLGRGELEHDIAVGALPAVAVVLPDGGSATPGPPVDGGGAFVRSLVDAVASSPRRDDTLVLVAHLTAGGYFDHVAPPPPPPLSVDASTGSATQASAVHYGPRVPLLVLGRFARRAFVSHVQLELSSITKFVEWNWMHGLALKGAREVNDQRRYRDTAVNNLGSLMDGDAAGIGVPVGSD